MESNNFNRISATGLKSVELDEITTNKIKIHYKIKNLSLNPPRYVNISSYSIFIILKIKY